LALQIAAAAHSLPPQLAIIIPILQIKIASLGVFGRPTNPLFMIVQFVHECYLSARPRPVFGMEYKILKFALKNGQTSRKKFE
jgi:hypothetical protein